MIWEAAVRPFTLNCCTIRRYLRIKIATFRKQTIAGGAYLLESLSDINIFQKLKTLQRYKSIKVEQLLYIYWGSRTAEDFVQTEFFSLFMGNTVSTKLLIWIFQNGRRPTPVEFTNFEWTNSDRPIMRGMWNSTELQLQVV